jgi:hypothetical protein
MTLLTAIFQGNAAEVLRLLRAGADPNQPSSLGDTPLRHAEDDFGLHEIAAILRSYGAEK